MLASGPWTRPGEGRTLLLDDAASITVKGVLETGTPPEPALLRPPASPVPTDRGSTRARTPGDDPAAAEVARLRRRISQQDHAIARLTEAMLTLRQGAQALREENRELRMQLAAAHSGRHRDCAT